MRLWGEPTSLPDISRVFSSYLRGTLPSNPWSEEPLRAETATISAHLIEMNDERHWWTVGSQPAVDGAPSADLVHGFGPKGGYVYQKAFVEFFLTSAELDELERKSADDARRRKESGEGDDALVTWFAGNARGEHRSNMAKGDVNAVTWGVFGAKEIVTTTLIEEMSFRAWCVRPPLPLSHLPVPLLGRVHHADHALLLSTPAGGSLCALAGVVAPVRRRLARSRLPARRHRDALARLDRPPRLQGPRRAVEVAACAQGAAVGRGASGGRARESAFSEGEVGGRWLLLRYVLSHSHLDSLVVAVQPATRTASATRSESERDSTSSPSSERVVLRLLLDVEPFMAAIVRAAMLLDSVLAERNLSSVISAMSPREELKPTLASLSHHHASSLPLEATALKNPQAGSPARLVPPSPPDAPHRLVPAPVRPLASPLLRLGLQDGSRPVQVERSPEGRQPLRPHRHRRWFGWTRCRSSRSSVRCPRCVPSRLLCPLSARSYEQSG